MPFLASGQARHFNFCSSISDECIKVQPSLLQLWSMGSGAAQDPANSTITPSESCGILLLCSRQQCVSCKGHASMSVCTVAWASTAAVTSHANCGHTSEAMGMLLQRPWQSGPSTHWWRLSLWCTRCRKLPLWPLGESHGCMHAIYSARGHLLRQAQVPSTECACISQLAAVCTAVAGVVSAIRFQQEQALQDSPMLIMLASTLESGDAHVNPKYFV